MKEVPFRANDIRGKYPIEVNESLFYHVGLVIPKVLKVKKIAIGRDIRISSNSLFSMLVEGLNHAGCDVIDLGLCDTPYTYFISGKYNLPCCMITASHNTKEYNGLKIVNSKAVPINEKQIKSLLSELKKIKHPHTHKLKEGKISFLDKRKEYLKFLFSQIDKKQLQPLKIVVDCSNGMASTIVKSMFSQTPAKVSYINEAPNGLFPNHAPNPAINENLVQLQKAVKKQKADLGIIYDGDCDRVSFVDEKGMIIDPSITASIFTHHFLENKPEKVVRTMTSGQILKDTIENYGGSVVNAKVGHRFIKEAMIRTKAIFGSEPSGHYYFNSNFHADSGILASLMFYYLVSKAKAPVSLVKHTFEKYFSLGEINYSVKDRDKTYKKLVSMIKSHKPDKQSNLDGYFAQKTNEEGNTTYTTIRKSNTEPVIRVTIESDSKQCALQFKKGVESIIKHS